jgi:L-rhamnose mutarotase
MRRFGRVLRLRAGARDEYERYHREIWPEVAGVLAAIGIRNYTIFCYADRWLFSYFELPDDADLAAIGAKAASSEACARWEKLMQTLQEPLPESASASGGEAVSWWVPMDELWHFDSPGDVSRI